MLLRLAGQMNYNTGSCVSIPHSNTSRLFRGRQYGNTPSQAYPRTQPVERPYKIFWLKMLDVDLGRRALFVCDRLLRVLQSLVQFQVRVCHFVRDGV